MTSHGHVILTTLNLLALSAAAILTIIQPATNIPGIAHFFMLAWLAWSIVFCLLSYQSFIWGYLPSLLGMMIAWRIACIYDVSPVTWLLLCGFLAALVNFFYCARQTGNWHDWQLVFIRLYLGLNFVPHFTEKLFAGSAPHLVDVQAFISLGVAHADFFVWLAGFCEFGAAIALSFGLFTRLGASLTVLYLLIATLLGHHFMLGFIWANVGGGWEFAVLWMVMIASFAVCRSPQFSFDQLLKERFNIPALIRWWM